MLTEQNPMNSRERVIRLIEHKPVDRVAKYEWFWKPTLERWQHEGLAGRSVEELFGLDISQFNVDNSFLFERQDVEETEDSWIYRDEWGILLRDFKDQRSTPHYLEFPVKSREEWDRIYKPLLRMEPRRFLLEKWAPVIDERHRRGQFVVIGGLMPFECAWRMVGMDNLLMMMAMEPDYVRDMFEVHTRLNIEMLQLLADTGLPIDGTFFAEDMAYKGRLMFSQKMYRTLLKDLHRQFFDFCHRQGWKVIMHSCGCLMDLVPDLVESGLDCLQALEVKAGMDTLGLKTRFGSRLALMGGVDARLFSEASDDEFEARVTQLLARLKPDGGYIFMSDHSIPPSVDFASYCRKMAIVEKYLPY
jgi:uroporphyrinogen decarboxylase